MAAEIVSSNIFSAFDIKKVRSSSIMVRER